jgi:uncharacterized RDD family membrane protein YckC
MSDDADVNTASGEDEGKGDRRLHLASWEARFWAWVIDVVVVGAVVTTVGEVTPVLPPLGGDVFELGFNGSATAVVLWGYWTVTEGATGQSVGKLALSLRVVDARGDAIGFLQAGAQAFGKAFLLPIDCLVGWLAMEGEYVRLFNRVSDTIVVDAGPRGEPEGVEYVTPDE